MKIEDKEYLKLKLNNLANTCDAIVSNIKKLDENKNHHHIITYSIDQILCAQGNMDRVFELVNTTILQENKN